MCEENVPFQKKCEENVVLWLRGCYSTCIYLMFICLSCMFYCAWYHKYVWELVECKWHINKDIILIGVPNFGWQICTFTRFLFKVWSVLFLASVISITTHWILVRLDERELMVSWCNLLLMVEHDISNPRVTDYMMHAIW
jgi:hypothetical protein